MKISMLIAAVLATATLAACEKTEKTTINPPATVVNPTASTKEVVPVQGPQGPAGEKGDKGDTGAMGSTGATGATGAQGEPGQKGEPGKDGAGVVVVPDRPTEQR